MRDYIIVTDSAGDLSQALVEELEVSVLPLSFTIQGETYLDWPDGREMSSKEFYDRVRSGAMPTTAAVNTQQYLDLLGPALEQGQDVLIISFSSNLSATYQSGVIAAEELREKFPERKIYTVDTLTASVGVGLLVWYAAQQRKAGKSIDEVRTWLEENKGKVCGWFTVSDLMHLKRGGRVSATTAMVGTMLQIKPLIHIDEEGRLQTVGKARGRKAALEALIDRFGETAERPEEQYLFISHADSLADARFVGEEIRKRYHTKGTFYTNVGPVVGSHTGPGCVTTFFLGSPR